MSRVYYDPPTCSELTIRPDALDLTLPDGNRSSCLTIPNPPPSSVTVSLSRQVVDFPRTTLVLVTVNDIDCRPEAGLGLLASAFCRTEPCGHRSACITLGSMSGKPCRFRCCNSGQPCGTFYLTLRVQGLKGTLCEVNVLAWGFD